MIRLASLAVLALATVAITMLAGYSVRDSYNGSLRIATPSSGFIPSTFSTTNGFCYTAMPVRTEWHLGEVSYVESGFDDISVRLLWLPTWPIYAATAMLWSVWGFFLLRWYRRHHHSRAGCCMQCGYDLRATPDHCPECGHVVSPPVVIA